MRTAQDVLDYMGSNFDKEASLKIKKEHVITINVAGQGGGTWQLILKKGEYQIQQGNEISPVDVTLNYKDLDSFHKLITGEMSGVRGYASGAIKIDGSSSTIVKIGKIFMKNKAKKKKKILRKNK